MHISRKPALSLVLLVALTALSIANPNSAYAAVVPSDQPQGHINFDLNTPHPKKSFTVNLSETVGTTDSSPSSQNHISKIIQGKSVETQVKLSEQMSIALDENENGFTLITRPHPEVTATTDRITNFGWSRTGVKQGERSIWYDENKIRPSLIDDHGFFGWKSLVDSENKIKINFVLVAGDLENVISPYVGTTFIQGASVENGAWNFFHYAVNPKDPLVFLILLPLSGFILVKSENKNFRITNPKRILSLFFIAIIISSAVGTPLSFSPEFMAFAYGEMENNQTITNQTLSNDTYNTNSSKLDFSQVSNSTVITNQTNSTIQVFNATAISNSTSKTNATLSFGQASNSTNPLSFDKFSNSTQVKNETSGNPLPQTNQTSGPVSTWKLNQSTINSTSIGDAQVSNSTGTPSLQLDGNGYLKQSVNSTSNLSNLTISSWVKPDYSQGSSQFTIVSKGNTFTLGINNNMPPAKKAYFSVFDGIKWNTVTSTSDIPEDWTHIAAAFNSTTISIYVNGKVESSQQISGIPTIALNGELTTKSVDNLSSKADVLVGAYLDYRGTATSMFSGSIQGVNLYGSLLSPSQILQQYKQSPLAIGSTQGTNSTQPIGTQPKLPVAQNGTTTNSTQNLSFSQISNATSLLNSTALANSTLANSTNDTAIPVTTSLVDTKKSYLITESPEFKFEYFAASDLKKFKRSVAESLGVVQQDGWTGTNGKIKIDIIGPDGHKISLKSAFQKLRDGKFDIKLGSQRVAKPGLYKVILTLTRNGKTYTVQDQFAWGLVSTNTQKSIYRPGETASFVIVVLNSTGNSVCNSNIVMTVTSPANQTSVLSSGNGIVPETQCGLYDANYTTTSEGNYTVNVQATTQTGLATFSTSFLAEKTYPFDIIRTADSKIDPVDNPNSFGVKIDVASFTNASSVTIRESVPSVFNVTTDGAVQTVGDTTTITWNKSLVGNSTSVQYTYSVPLQYPQLYALGPAQITYGSGQAFTEARPWFVAVDPIVFNSGASQTTIGTCNTYTTLATVTSTASPVAVDNLLIGSVQVLQGSTTAATLNARITGGATTPANTFTIDLGTTSAQTNSYTVLAKDTSSAATTYNLQVCKTAGTVNAQGKLLLINSMNNNAYIDSDVGSAGGVSLPTNANTQVVSTGATSLPAGTNVVIASVQLQNSGTSSGTIAVGNVKLTGAATISNLMTMVVGTAAPTKEQSILLVGKDSGAAGQSYSVSVTTPNTAGISFKGAAKILVVQPATAPVSVATSSVVTVGTSSTAFFTAASTTFTTSQNVIAIGSEELSTTNVARTVTASTNNLLLASTAETTNTYAIKALATATPYRFEELWGGNPPSNSPTLGLVATSSGTGTLTGWGRAIAFVATSAYTQTLSETLSSTDSVSRTYLAQQTALETLSSTDVISSTHKVTQPLTETLSSTDAVSRTYKGIQPLTESLASSDAVSRTYKGIQPLTESLSSSDALIRTHNVPVQTVTESLSSTDAVSRTYKGIQPLTESLASSDAVSRTYKGIQPLTESLTSSDAVTGAHATTQPLTETLATSDAAARTYKGIQILSESVSTSDALVKNYAAIQSLTESLASSDSVSRTHNLPTQSLTESLASSDAVSRTYKGIQPLTESLASSDAVSRTYKGIQPLTESLTSSDAVTGAHATTQPLTETLATSDAAARTYKGIQILSESVSTSDALVKNYAAIQSLTESLSSSDALIRTHNVPVQTVTESLSSTDAVSRTYKGIQPLTESLASSDAVSRTYKGIQPLTESLSSTDAVTNGLLTVQSLTESLSSSDVAAKTYLAKQPLAETLSSTDAATRIFSGTQPLTESLSSSDAVTRTHNLPSQTLTETLASSDAASKTYKATQTLGESLSSSDAASRTFSGMQTLSETLAASDTTTRGLSTTVTLTEQLASSDVAARTYKGIQSLPESLGTSDAAARTYKGTQSLSETLASSDTTTRGLVTIQTLSESLASSDSAAKVQSSTQKLSESLTSSDSAARIHTIPVQTLTDSLSSTDTVSRGHAVPTQSLTESLASADSLARAYLAKQSLPESLSASDTISRATIKTLSESLSSSDSILRGNLQVLQESLSGLDSLVPEQKLTIAVSESLGYTDGISKAQNLAQNQQLVGAGQADAAVDSSKPQLVITDSAIALTDVTVPSNVTNPSIDFGAIVSAGTVHLPTHEISVTKAAGLNQPMISVSFPANTTISGGGSWDGVLNLPATMSTPPTLSLPVQSGSVATLHYLMSVGSSIPLQFNQPVRLLLQGEAGLAVGYFYDPAHVTQIKNACTSDSVSGMPSGANECSINVGSDLAVWTKHFTGFGTWSSSSGPSASVASLAGGPAGSVGTGPSSSSSSSTSESVGSFGGTLAPVLNIDSVSYDMCKSQTVDILVEYSDSNPSVVLRTSLTGVVQASVAKDQPYAQENLNSTIQKIVYEASINPKEKSFEVMALQAAGSDVNSVGQTIDVTSCTETINFAQGQAMQSAVEDQSAPKIFDVRNQIGNGTFLLADSTQFASANSMTVSAIISSPTPVDQVQLRFAVAGAQPGTFDMVPMSVSQLPISNSTYKVTGTIPQEMMVAPAISYWVDVHNTAQKTADSDPYTIGVKSTYPVVGDIQMDMLPVRASGTITHPVAYFNNNSTGPVYGTVSLVSDGQVVYTSPGIVFGTGQTQVVLEWTVPAAEGTKDYQVHAIANIYGKSFDTGMGPMTAFQSVQTISLSNSTGLNAINEGNQTVANPAVLYSSFKNDGTMRFQVNAPDGTCVIGGSDKCLVSKSTVGLRGNFKIVNVGDQTYLVRYSGTDSPLERFSITSTDPIVGDWKVQVVSQDGLVPQAEAANDVFLKVKYTEASLTPVTLDSK